VTPISAPETPDVGPGAIHNEALFDEGASRAGGLHMPRRSLLVLVVIVSALYGFAPPASAATIDVGTSIAITPTSFALPLEVTDAAGLAGWEFSLLYDPADVRIDTACDPFSDTYCDFLTGPVTEGPFFSSGVPFNLLNPGAVLLDSTTLEQIGTLLAAQGAYGGPTPPPSGDGVIAYVRFMLLGSGTSPITVTDASVTQVPVPEPQSVLLLTTALFLLTIRQTSRRWRRLPGGMRSRSYPQEDQ
jgi:hypothetical protein